MNMFAESWRLPPYQNQKLPQKAMEDKVTARYIFQYEAVTVMGVFFPSGKKRGLCAEVKTGKKEIRENVSNGK